MRTRLHTSWMLPVVALCVAGLPAAYANIDETVVMSDFCGNTDGGEFLATYSNFGFAPASTTGSAANQFESFCIERTENISFGTLYYVTLSDAATYGGGGGGGVSDPLDPLTAYLYSQFITDQLSGYTYDLSDGGVARAASADALQHVIWYIEQEEPKAWTDGDASKMDLFFQDALAHAGQGIGNVRVMNLWQDSAGTLPAQDQLVMTPEPGTIVCLLLGLLLPARRR
jgi:hypothetical protein